MNQEILNEKAEVVAHIKDLVKDSQGVVVCEYRGLTVVEVSLIKRELTKLDAHCSVFKNSLVNRATEEEFKGFEEYLTGPNMFVFFKDPTNGSLKQLAKFAKKYDCLKIKGGIIDSKVQDDQYVKVLANLPSKEGLVSMFLSVLQAPIRNLAYSLDQVASKK